MHKNSLEYPSIGAFLDLNEILLCIDYKVAFVVEASLEELWFTLLVKETAHLVRLEVQSARRVHHVTVLQVSGRLASLGLHFISTDQ